MSAKEIFRALFDAVKYIIAAAVKRIRARRERFTRVRETTTTPCNDLARVSFAPKFSSRPSHHTYAQTSFRIAATLNDPVMGRPPVEYSSVMTRRVRKQKCIRPKWRKHANLSTATDGYGKTLSSSSAIERVRVNSHGPLWNHATTAKRWSLDILKTYKII